MAKSTGTLLMAALALAMNAGPASPQPRRVDPAATDILGYRLTADNVRRLDAVTRAMDRVPDRGAEAPRTDVAMLTVLTMGWAYGEPWRNSTVDGMVRDIDRGHADLAAAIRSAGLSTRDWVLATMNLLLAHPIVALRRQGRTGAPLGDVAPENVAWVDANWSDADRVMREIQQRVAAARSR